MKLVGKDIAEKVYQSLRSRVEDLQKKSVTPHLVVFLIGENPASVAYVRQKRVKGEDIGCKVTVINLPTTVTTEELEKQVKELNDDPTVHGILIQRPVPEHVDIAKLELLTKPEKDIDGFHPDSPYTFPIPMAVMQILDEVFGYQAINQGWHGQKGSQSRAGSKADEHDGKETVTGPRQDTRQDPVEQTTEFIKWLKAQNIVIIGKGPTGGKPIMAEFEKQHIPFNLIDSKTTNREELLKSADIIISAVGRENVIKAEELKHGVILIGVGIFRGTDGKLHGDYNEEDIDGIASYYTTTPGGVGPVNVAMLFENVLTAAEK